jgi:hypothetical protein
VVALGDGAQVVGQGRVDLGTSLQESGPGTGGGTRSVWLASVRHADAVSHTIGISAVCPKTPTGYRVHANPGGPGENAYVANR